MITLINKQDIPLDTTWVESLVEHFLTQLGYSGYEISIVFTTNDDMQHYNETYRHKKGPTDILSFSYHQLKPGQAIEPATEDDKNLGDLILAPAYIKAFTDKEGLDFEQRLMILITHGMCHLLGYDHVTDEDYALMKAKEDELLSSIPKHLER